MYNTLLPDSNFTQDSALNPTRPSFIALHKALSTHPELCKRPPKPSLINLWLSRGKVCSLPLSQWMFNVCIPCERLCGRMQTLNARYEPMCSSARERIPRAIMYRDSRLGKRPTLARLPRCSGTPDLEWSYAGVKIDSRLISRRLRSVEVPSRR
jgi:hypothetical protein